MAKINFTAFLSDARGKVAGTVFSRNRAGAYARTKVTPVNPSSTYQSTVRSRLTGNSQGWRGITAAQRLGWNNGAVNFPRTDVFGNQQILSGQQLYVGLNNNLINAGIAVIPDCPTPQSVFALTSASFTAAKGTPSLSLTFAATPVPANNGILVFATPGVSPGKSFVKPLYKQIAVIAAAATSPANLLTAYTNRYGVIPVAGQKLFLKLIPVNTVSGQSGQSLEISAIVAA